MNSEKNNKGNVPFV